MSHSICIIDDGIPTERVSSPILDDTRQLDVNTLRLLLEPSIDWGGQQLLKKLIVQLVDEKDDNEKFLWDVYAFKNPNLLLNSITDCHFRFDIVIFDWDYPGVNNQEEILIKILNASFALVWIYSGADQEEKIRTILNSTNLKPFSNRTDYVDKNKFTEEAESHKKLIEKVKIADKENFSFRFGRQIQQESLKAVDKILVELGKATLNQISNYFKLTGDSKRDLVDFVSERFKNYLAVINLDDLPDESATQGEEFDENLAKKLWEYRLYFYPNPTDDVVRKGDIIYKADHRKDTLYLIITSDCDLGYCWHKNFGYLNLVPLTKVDKSQTNLISKLQLTRDFSKVKNKFSQTSLTNKIGDLSEGPFLLPFLIIDDTSQNYIGFPKEINCVEVQKPNLPPGKDLSKEGLKYSHWTTFKRAATVSEPFLSPLIEHITRSLSGFGVPDYSEQIQDVIKKMAKEALS